MKQTREHTSPDQAAMPQELAGAVNLMAHPMAGVAAMGALGFALASQAAGLWFGAVAGAAEASRTMLKALPEPDTAPRPVRRTANLKLVVSKPSPEAKPAPAKKVAKAQPMEPQALTKPAGIEKPAAADDLKAISGVGPKLEKVLNDLGIWTYGQIAGLDGAEIAWLDDHLGFSGRITRDDWVGQAKALSGGV